MSDMSSSDSTDASGNMPDLTQIDPTPKLYGPSTVGYTENNGTYVANADGTLDFVPNDPGVITTTDPVTGAVTATGGNATGASSNTAGSSDWSTIAKNMLGAAATPGGIGALASLLGAALGANKPGTSPGWHGTIDPNLEAQRQQIQQPAYEPYSGKPVMGSRQFTDLAINPKGTSSAPMVNGVPLADYVAKKGIGSLPKDFGPKEDDQAGPLQPGKSFTPENQNNSGVSGKTYAMGGVASLAHGGRYLNGPTDGMADKLDTTIDGTQAAKLSHGEFVIPADVVSHLGNGNSTAGADVLYKMMDRVRKARTGNPKQGKQINPEKFMPGGLASLPTYANGGVIGFDGTNGSAVTSAASGTQGTATSVPVTTESNLSSWAGPGVADYIQRGTALSQEPYQAYTGPLTAGVSPLQQQAFTAASNLTTPESIGQAGITAGNIGTAMSNLTYNPDTATNQFTAPGEYQSSTNANQYTGTSPYAAANMTTGQFGLDQAQQYMNPYLQASLDPQLAEARRQSQITQMGNNAQATKAGAFGGSRGALMNAETQRSLGTNLANITGQGYNTAYTNAMNQFNADQTRNLTAQQQNEQSRQFGAQQGLSNAQNAAQYGMAALNANEQSKQFGATQGMTAAEQAAQYGQQAQTQNAQNKQFGSTFGLNSLTNQLSAANSQANIGSMQNQVGLANLQALTNAGTTQQAIEAQNVAAQKAEFEAERQDPFNKVTYEQGLYQGLPVSTATSSTSTTPAQQIGQALNQATTTGNQVTSLVNKLTGS